MTTKTLKELLIAGAANVRAYEAVSDYGQRAVVRNGELTGSYSPVRKASTISSAKHSRECIMDEIKAQERAAYALLEELGISGGSTGPGWNMINAAFRHGDAEDALLRLAELFA